MKWEPGMMVGEQVRLVQPLGRPSGGNLWIGDQIDWRKQVVVKFVTTGVPLDDLEALVEFVERAAAGTQFESQRVVQAFDFGLTDEGVPYVVRELLEGESLEQRLARGRTEPVEAGKVVAQVAEALAVAHEAGIAHGGIEPAKIFLCRAEAEPCVKILDFGIAGARKPLRTSNYISPEQYMLKPFDHRSDIWSLGVVAYEMLTGDVPVEAEQRRKLKWDFTPPSEMWLADIPDDIDRWFDRALAKRPDDRFASVVEMANGFIDLMPGIEGKLGEKRPRTVQVGAHKVIAVGSEDPAAEPAPASDPDALSIEVDD